MQKKVFCIKIYFYDKIICKMYELLCKFSMQCKIKKG